MAAWLRLITCLIEKSKLFFCSRPLIKFRRSKQPVIGLRCSQGRRRSRCRLYKQGRSSSSEIGTEIQFRSVFLWHLPVQNSCFTFPCFSDEVSLDNKKDDFISEELVSTFTDPADVFDDNEEIFDDDGDTYYTINDNQLVDDNIILSDDEWDSFPRFGWW